MDVPVLETPRLRLRAHVVGDFPAVMAMWSQDAVIHYISGKPMRPDECWTRILRYRGLWPLVGFGYWAVEEKDSGRFVGDVGFGDFHRMIEPPIHGFPEAGWVVSPDFHGKGYASEAVAAALGWLDAAGKGRSVCIIDPENTPSLRIAAKNGFREYQRTTFMSSEVILLERV
ncbi:GNAT family N-acetyltransferase [Nordella sp. HKS 07]|uniref:GNAT family N-acetyltransferase n=1 Tax=Nordella sp. HKS 07 TaxID=2712222 RepID=UPI0013E10015|nr:GNAT family N-acetyltransferase [Nordella sp. HKS 07]QIG46360.1 GNAT family N-acetyltransferase [Nordella sp. HKS 07]